MYEIWLMLNIAWESALLAAPLLLGAAALWVLLLVLALRAPGARWRPGLPLALAVGAVAAALAFVWLPTGLGSSLRELNYWVDWATLLGLAAGAGAVAAAFAWPLLALRRGTAAR